MSFFDAFGTGPADRARALGTADLDAAGRAALPYYQQGIGALTQNYGAALPAWAQQLKTANQGVTAYGNATGVNGPVGSAKALQAFYASPAFQSQIWAGNNAQTAADAASGKTGSGSEVADLAKLNQRIAGTGWNNYVSSLAPYFNLDLGAAQGQTGVYTGLGSQLNNAYGGIGNMFYGLGASKSNMDQNDALAAYAASGNQLNFASNVLGGALKGAFTLSDERAKEDVEPVGALADGQTVYRYKYIGDPVTRLGLIAQEVGLVNPEAVAEVLPGILGVDYRGATDRASALMRLAA